MGTARISSDPGAGVCGRDGSVNGVSGLYVVDASLFPTAVGVNPMMTIIALSKRVAAGIAERATPS
jgi:choline dehydrogenase-like flavoprotein